jgi:CheY-like chemotaxis protein/two-component sensor histidine kinase
VLGYGELLTNAPLAVNHRAWLNALRSHGDIMLRLVNDLIDLGALQSGAFQLENAPARLRKLIDDCVASLRPAATERGLTLGVSVAGDVPDWVITDSVRLRQILLNLLTNAVKFTPAGSVTLAVKRGIGTRIEFVVTDSGPGIPEALRPRLFQPFTRLDPASGGSGLGLALVHGLCAAMGGTVVLGDSAEGAVFTVTLPLPEQQPAGPRAAFVPDARKFAGMRIIVAEDNTLVREMLLTFLGEHGAEVFAAGDGPAAISRVRDHAPDVLLLDIALPELDGIAVAKAVRKEHGSLVRIIGLSAHASPADESRARAAGMDAFFTKPVSLAALADTLAPRPGAALLPTANTGSRITDEALRTRLLADFANETPRLMEEMQAALAAKDWSRLRSRAHYLKNSADILGVGVLQEACERLASFEDNETPDAVRLMLDRVTSAIPEKALASASASAADLV